MDISVDAVRDDGIGAPELRVGARLKQQRLERRLELADVARETRVPMRHLAAIEADEHESLPALPYTIGFVKSYARCVGLSPDEIGAQFRAETPKAHYVPMAAPLEPLDEKRVPPRGVVAACAAAIVLLIGGVAAFSTGVFGDDEGPAVAAAPTQPSEPLVVHQAAARPAPTPNGFDVPPGSAAQQVTEPATAGGDPAVQLASATPAPAEGAAATDSNDQAQSADAQQVAMAGGPVVITASEDAWLKVYDKSTKTSVKMGILKAGERYEVPRDQPDLMLWTGRAGALQISVGGKTLPPLGGQAETVRDVSLTPAALLARAG